jgi:L-alanine-DL-glutamate epimerase-like enolase superfamily enzyme
VRAGAPDVRLIVDANESWHDRDIAAEAAALAALGVEMVEQPVRHGAEDRLAGVRAPLPLCADESCHTRADLKRLGDFDAVNIKLDKAGGLTEALALRAGARERGFRVMVGCMLGTSLSIAPAALAAQGADWIDLDGALLLAEDRDGGLPMRDGMLHPGALWGTGQ